MGGRKYALAGLIAFIAVLPDGCGVMIGSSRPASATSRQAVAAAVTDYLVPVSGMALVEGQSSIYNYPAKVADDVVDACLVAKGMPRLPAEPGPTLAGAVQFPNLSYIESHRNFGFGTVVRSSDPTRDMTVKAKRAYNRTIKRCSPRLQSLAVTVGLGERVFSEWLTQALGLLSTSRQVRGANRAGARCSRATGFPATTYEDEQTVVGDASDAHYARWKDVLGRRIERQGADVFVRCFGRAVEVADRSLDSRSRAFLTVHATAIRRLQNETWKQVRFLETKYHVAFETPAAVASQW